MKKIVYLIILVFMVSCSSQPKNQRTPLTQEADNMYRLGKRLSSQGKLPEAQKSFAIASDRYSLIDNLDGYVLSQIALAGTMVKRGETTAYLGLMEELERLILIEKPQYKDNLLLLNAEIAFIADNHEQVADITTSFKSKDIVIETQILSIRMMSLLKIEREPRSELRRLVRNTKKLRRYLKKNRVDESGVYAYANYILGYYYVHKQDWKKAKNYFEVSLQIDKNNDNSYGSAQNLYMLGTAYKNLNQRDVSLIYYQRALQIFKLLNNKAMISKTTEKIQTMNLKEE